jgi:hypothetical protein
MADDEAIVELVRDELERITDTGELASRARLREAVGLGAGDLERALGVLRDRGQASEVEPDGYRLVRDEHDLVPGPGQPVVPEPGVSLAEAEAAKPAGPMTAFQAGDYREEYERSATVTMPRAMVDAIDADALGKILKAGIDAAPDGEAFVFEVTP